MRRSARSSEIAELDGRRCSTSRPSSADRRYRCCELGPIRGGRRPLPRSNQIRQRRTRHAPMPNVDAFAAQQPRLLPVGSRPRRKYDFPSGADHPMPRQVHPLRHVFQRITGLPRSPGQACRASDVAVRGDPAARYAGDDVPNRLQRRVLVVLESAARRARFTQRQERCLKIFFAGRHTNRGASAPRKTIPLTPPIPSAGPGLRRSLLRIGRRALRRELLGESSHVLPVGVLEVARRVRVAAFLPSDVLHQLAL